MEYLIFLRLLAVNSPGVPATLTAESGAPPQLRSLLASREVKQLAYEFADHVGSVEVLRGDSLQPLIFRVPDTVRRASDTRAYREMKAATLFTVPRENPYAKVDGFVSTMSRMKAFLIADPRLKDMNIVRLRPWLAEITYSLALALNLLLLAVRRALCLSPPPLFCVVYAHGCVCSFTRSMC